MDSDAIPPDPLTQALLQRLDLGEESDPRRAVLVEAVEEMMRAPTAQAAGRDFLAESATAAVRFESIEAKGVASWNSGVVTVTVQERYLDGEAESHSPSLPVLLSHELLGHGLWHARGGRQKVWQAVHHHELNEVYALLLSWAVEIELEGRLRDGDAHGYLADPQSYLAQLKLLMPYYALSFSSDAMRRPIETIETRLAWMAGQKADVERFLENLHRWTVAMDALVARGKASEDRLVALRRNLAAQERAARYSVRMIGLGVGELETVLEKMRAETDRQSERYLIWAADCPAVLDLTRETEAMERRLRALVAAAPPAADDPPAASDDDGQLTLAEMGDLYQRDLDENPGLWSQT